MGLLSTNKENFQKKSSSVSFTHLYGLSKVVKLPTCRVSYKIALMRK